MVRFDIISGFLGAGKTTFANLLLRHYMNQGLKPVYIVNEFGQTGLDAQIIESEGFESMEMEGGCICCTLKNDVATTIDEVIKRFAPDIIVFEPSGVFIFNNFLEIIDRNKCEIGNIFTIVDSINFDSSKNLYGSFIYNQIKNAPLIILSKLEKCEQKLQELICDILNINPTAYITTQKWADLDLAQLLDVEKEAPQNTEGKHSHKLQTITIPMPNELKFADIEAIIQKQKHRHWGDVYRIKGILIVDSQRMLLNIASDEAECKPYKGYAEPSLTFIGNEVYFDKIEKITNFMPQ